MSCVDFFFLGRKISSFFVHVVVLAVVEYVWMWCHKQNEICSEFWQESKESKDKKETRAEEGSDLLFPGVVDVFLFATWTHTHDSHSKGTQPCI